jgi:hypothetical protein
MNAHATAPQLVRHVWSLYSSAPGLAWVMASVLATDLLSKRLFIHCDAEAGTVDLRLRTLLFPLLHWRGALAGLTVMTDADSYQNNLYISFVYILVLRLDTRELRFSNLSQIERDAAAAQIAALQRGSFGERRLTLHLGHPWTAALVFPCLILLGGILLPFLPW